MHLKEYPSTLFRLARRSPLAASLVSVAAAAVLWSIIFVPAYDTNDDVAMQLIASGFGTPENGSPRLILTHVAVGHALNALYRSLPSWPWYGIYLLGAHLVSHAAILYALLSAPRPGRRGLAYAQFAAVLGTYFIIHLQFTTTAFMVAQAGVALIVAAARIENHRTAWRCMLFACGLLLFASLVRFQVFVCVSAMASPILGYCIAHTLWRVPQRRAMFTFPLLACGGLVVAMVVVNARAYQQNDAWRRFYELRKVLAVADYPSLYQSERMAGTIEDVGWSENDTRLLQTWYWSDERLFTVEKLARVSAAAFEDWTDGMLGRFLKTAYRLARRPVTFYGTLALAVALMLIQPTGRRLAVFALVACLAFAAGSYLASWGRLPERVYVVLLAFPCFSVVLVDMLPGDRRTARAHASKAGIFWAAVCLAMLNAQILFFYYLENRSQLRGHAGLKQDLNRLTLREGEILVGWGADLPLHHILPLERAHYATAKPLCWIAWYQRSPYDRQRLKRLGVEDVGRALFVRNQCLVVVRPEHHAVLEQYALEHYQRKIAFVEAFEGTTFRAYRIIEKE